jgi:hypothetical protein
MRRLKARLRMHESTRRRLLVFYEREYNKLQDGVRKLEQRLLMGMSPETMRELLVVQSCLRRSAEMRRYPPLVYKLASWLG